MTSTVFASGQDWQEGVNFMQMLWAVSVPLLCGPATCSWWTRIHPLPPTHRATWTTLHCWPSYCRPAGNLPPPHAHVIHRSNLVWSCPPPRDCDKTAPQLLSRHTTHILDGNVHGFHASDSGSFLSPLQLIWLPAISQFPLSFCPHYTVGSVGRCDYLYSYPVTTVPGQCLGRCVQLYSLLVQSDNAVASWLHDHCSRVCLSVID